MKFFQRPWAIVQYWYDSDLGTRTAVAEVSTHCTIKGAWRALRRGDYPEYRYHRQYESYYFYTVKLAQP